MITFGKYFCRPFEVISKDTALTDCTKLTAKLWDGKFFLKKCSPRPVT